MKKFIFATVSGLALSLAYPVYAEDASSTDVTTPAEAAAAPTAASAAPAAPKAATAPMAKVVHHHKHHAHHHKHHAHSHVGMATTEVAGVYVTFPPVDECGRPVCTPSYYAGNQECPYQYHGGYFWYPHAHANLLEGYVPYNYNGMYWYASRMHPHVVYVDRTPMVYTLPHPMDGRMYAVQPAPMARKWESAPVIRSAE